MRNSLWKCFRRSYSHLHTTIFKQVYAGYALQHSISPTWRQWLFYSSHNGDTMTSLWSHV